MLSALGKWAGRVLFRVTPAVTRDLDFSDLNPKDRPFLSPLTTHMGLWRIYSYPDPPVVLYNSLFVLYNPKPFIQKCKKKIKIHNCVVNLSFKLFCIWDIVDYLLLYVPLKNSSLIWRRHHCRWRAVSFALRAFDWAGRNLYRVKPAVTRDLDFSALLLARHTRECVGSILTRILKGVYAFIMVRYKEFHKNMSSA
jgi:hypothetical protein